MNKVTEVRLTIAAFIHGIETDLKALLNRYVSSYHESLSFLKSSELAAKVWERYVKDNPNEAMSDDVLAIVEYLDLGDIVNTIHVNRDMLPDHVGREFEAARKKLIDLIPIRNRVMHTRPLMMGDFVSVYEFVAQLKNDSAVGWFNAIEIRDRIESDASYVLTLSLPVRNQVSHVMHNLPSPDFDETGFIGRSRDIEDLRRLVLSNKVVSIIGEGGVGKTALALKVAYDIVDMDEKSGFDMIIWTTAKTMALTSKGIVEIRDSARNVIDLNGLIASRFDIAATGDNVKEEIFEHFDVYKTLLVIDNLETIQNEEVLDFIREVQMHCHVLITSRIGLGELEFRKPLQGLTANESVSLVRELARVRNSQYIRKIDTNELQSICSRLYFNPLAIKWFVNTIEIGADPSYLLNRKEELLNFCLSNVYDKLGVNARRIISIIRGARRELNIAEIRYLSGLPMLDVQKTMNELFRTTFIGRNTTGKGSFENMTYYVSEFVKDYLNRVDPLKSDDIKEWQRKLRNLSSEIMNIKQVTEYNEFGLYALKIRTSNERLSAKALQEALSYSKEEKYSEALAKVSEARDDTPNWIEVYRISAFIKARMADLSGAEEDYETAVSLDPADPRLLYYYAQFVLFEFEDVDKSRGLWARLVEVRPDALYTLLLDIRILNVEKKYGEALDKLVQALDKYQEARDRRVVQTELMTAYLNVFQFHCRVSQDYAKAREAYDSLVKTFEVCVKDRNTDAKMIKNFCDALYLYLGYDLCNDTVEDKKFIDDIFARHAKHISDYYRSDRLHERYARRFNQSASMNLDIMRGYIRKGDDANNGFVFIEWDGGSIYASRQEFTDVYTLHDWRSIQGGQEVEFEIGENYKGQCAIRVRRL